MSESISSLLECSLCFEVFDNNTRLPKMLSCQHTACLDCLVRMVGKKTKIICPTCRFEYKVPKNGVSALSNNLTIISMMNHVTEKERRQSVVKRSNVQTLRRSLLSTIQTINNKMSKLDSVTELTPSTGEEDQKTTMKSIDNSFQRIYLSLEKRREVLRNDVDVHVQKENEVALQASTIEESKRKAVSFCSEVVDTLEGNSNPTEQELTSLLRTAADVLTKIDEVNQQIIDLNATITQQSNRSIVFTNIMEDSLVSQISYLGRIQGQYSLPETVLTENIIHGFVNPAKNNAIGVKEPKLDNIQGDDVLRHLKRGEQMVKIDEHLNIDENCITKGGLPDKNLATVGNSKTVELSTTLKVVLNGRPVNYKWNDEEPLTFGLDYFTKLEEGPLDLALIRNATTKELAVTTEFSHSIGVFDEKLCLKKQLGEPWSGHRVRGLCTDDRGRLLAVTNIGDILLFDNNCPSMRVKRIYSVYQGQGAVHSDYASSKCGLAISSKRILYLANDRDGCVDAIRGKTGKLIRKIGKNHCMEPRGIALTSDEKILIADARNHCVWLYAQDGQCVGKYGKQGKGIGELSEPWGVDVDRDDNVVVADTGNHRVQIFDKGGSSLATLGEHGSDVGQFDWPMSVTVTINRKIIVCDSGNYRIQIL